MKKGILRFLLALCMVLSLLPATVLATEATSGAENVETLDELVTALADTSNDLPILITSEIEIPADQTVVLDLNGKTVNAVFNGDSTTNHIYALRNYGNLTITDTSAKKDGSISSRGIYNYGKLTMEAGTINAIDGNGGYAVNNKSGAEFIMNGGKLATTYEDDYRDVNGGSDATALGVPAGTTATLNGGIITSVCDFPYAVVSGGTLNIPADSTVEISSIHGAVAVTGGTTIIDAGTFFVSADGYVRTDNVIYVEGGKLIINGGTFTGDSDKVAGGCCVCDMVGAAVINGGTFGGSSGGDVWGTTGTTIKGGVFANLIETSHIAEGYAALPDLNGCYVVGTKPTATVNNLGEMTVPAGNYYIYNGSLTQGTVDMPLNFVMQFVADQTAEDMLTSPFASWYADFVITFENIEGGSFDPAGCYLAGYYGETDSWDGLWVKIPVEGVLKSIDEDVRYPVMMGVGMPQLYDYICSGVQAFSCAMYIPEEILNANPNLKVKLELNVVDSSNDNAALDALVSGEKIYKVSEKIYNAEDFREQVKKNYVAEINGVGYETLADAIKAAQDGDTIELKKNTSCSALTIEKSITIDFGGKGLTVNATENVTTAITIAADAEVTFKSGRVVVAADAYATLIENNGTFTATDMEIIGTKLVDTGSVTLINNDKMTIEGESIVLANAASLVAIVNNGTSCTINLNVNSTEVNSRVYGNIQMKSGNLHVVAIKRVGGGLQYTAGTVTRANADVAVNTPAGYCWNAENALQAHDFVKNPVAKYLKNKATINSKAVYYMSCENCGLASEEVFEHGDILGGYVATVITSENVYTNYETLAKALEAAEDGDTIVLKKHTDCSALTIEKSITIDFGSKGLTVNATENVTTAITIAAGAEVTFKGGRVVVAADTYATLIENNGTFTATDMEIIGTKLTNTDSATLINSSVMTIEGESIVLANATSRVAIVNNGTSCTINLNVNSTEVNSRVYGRIKTDAANLTVTSIKQVGGRIEYAA